MNTKITISIIAGLCLCAAVAMAQSDKKETPQKPAKTGEAQKAKINSILKELRQKVKDSKPAEYEVALPVATAGARGAEVRQANRFAVIWPDAGISPLMALAQSLRYGVESGAKPDELKAQIDDFKKVFPEFSADKLLIELADTVAPAK